MLRGKSLRPGGPTGTALGDLNITVGGDIDITKEPDAPVILLGSVDTVRGTYQFQGRRFDLVRGGTVRFIGRAADQPAARRHGDARDPEHRRRGARAHHRQRQGAGARADQQSAARRVRHPGADRLQPPGQRAGLRREARRWRRPPAALPAASSPRRSATRSAARSISICSRSRRPPTPATSAPA